VLLTRTETAEQPTDAEAVEVGTTTRPIATRSTETEAPTVLFTALTIFDEEAADPPQ